MKGCSTQARDRESKRVSEGVYTQFILIRNGSIRNASRIYGFFKKQLAALLKRNRKSISIFLRNALMESFQNKKHMGR